MWKSCQQGTRGVQCSLGVTSGRTVPPRNSGFPSVAKGGWLAWTLQSPSWDTWLSGRGRQGLALAISGAQYPVCSLGPCSASRNQAVQYPRLSPCSVSSCTAWHRTIPSFTSVPGTPQLLPALPTPPLADKPMAQARGSRAVRYDAPTQEEGTSAE